VTSDLLWTVVVLLSAISVVSLAVLCKRSAQQAVAEWRLGHSLMKQLDASLETERAALLSTERPSSGR